ncbi:DUF1479-domain-containing protein [Phellopilus nigrolimitatus]|nr:DUF1479-domain-containing protein [Phellopilus nigrolimitatus]
MGQADEHSTLPPRFIDLKTELVKDRDRLQNAWNDLLAQLKSSVEETKKEGSNIIPQVEFSELQNLSPDKFKDIKRRGAVLVKNVVDSGQATAWRDELTAFVKTNPVEGFPEDDKQFFQLYWTRPQVQARAHPNVLSLIGWLNNLYHIGTPPKSDQVTSVDLLKSVELSTPLVYADRFRIRHPGVQWNTHPPHIDGGGIERWEDANFRSCYNDILNGEWEKHDPYDLAGRLNAKISLYGRPGQASVFRTFQGWISLSETAPTQGTLKVFPDLTLSNAYLILRPFFHLKKKLVSDDPLDQQNWEFDISTPDFPGIFERDGGFFGPRLTPQSHPHLRLSESMTSVPLVRPGDMIFWHCDVVHSVEQEHTGNDDSAVMYIPAVPLTPQNLAYIERQKESFLKGIPPPDFPKGAGEDSFIGTGRETDVIGETARKAMGLAY